MKIGDIVTGIDYFGNIIAGEYEGKRYVDGKHKGYWISTCVAGYEDCPQEDYNRLLYLIKEIID